jgi:hypothetical protein
MIAMLTGALAAAENGRLEPARGARTTRATEEVRRCMLTESVVKERSKCVVGD